MLRAPTECSSTIRSSALISGASTTGAWPRGTVALGVVGTCKLLRSISWLAFLFIHFMAWSAPAGAFVWLRNWSKSTTSGGAGRPRLSTKGRSSNQVFTTRSCNGGLLRVLNLFLCNSTASLFLFRLERVRQNARWLVRAHAQEHGDEAIDALLDGLAVVLVHIDGSGLLLVDGLSQMGAARPDPSGCLQLLVPLLPGALPRLSPSSEASHPPHDAQRAPPPGHSRCRHRRSRCLPTSLQTRAIGAPAAQDVEARSSSLIALWVHKHLSTSPSMSAVPPTCEAGTAQSHTTGPAGSPSHRVTTVDAARAHLRGARALAISSQPWCRQAPNCARPTCPASPAHRSWSPYMSWGTRSAAVVWLV